MSRHNIIIALFHVYSMRLYAFIYTVYCPFIGLQKRLNNTCYEKKTPAAAITEPAAGTVVIYNSAWQGYIITTNTLYIHPSIILNEMYIYMDI